VVAPPVVLVHSQLAVSSTESVCRTKGTVRVAGDEEDVARIAILTAVSAFHFPGSAVAESQMYLSGDVQGEVLLRVLEKRLDGLMRAWWSVNDEF